MSSGERKKRIHPHGVKGWEEAGGEFYQESYPGAESDLEVMQNDPHRISTLLPSKKTRYGSVKKEAKLATLRHRTTMRSRCQTNVGASHDVQIACLPDLSENLSNEKLLWEEIMKIKSMPLNMTQKKELKMKLLSRDTLRLQGFQQFTWKRKQWIMHLKTRITEIGEKLTLWRGSLKRIEGCYGTGVLSFFQFVKWLIFLNVILSFIMTVLIFIPTFYLKEHAVSLKNISDSGNNISSPFSVIQNEMFHLLIPLSLDTSPLYYGYYNYFLLDLHYFKFDLAFGYILATFLCLLYSFVSVLKNAASGFKHRLLESQGQFYVHCNIVFSGWDYCVLTERSSKMKHKALYNEILGRLVAQRQKEEHLNRTKQEWLKLFLVRLFINVFILFILCLAGYVIFLAFKSTRRTLPTLTAQWYSKILIEFTPSSCIVFFNIVLPYLFHWLCRFEHLNPMSAVQITIFRTVILRFSTLCVLLGSVYEKQNVKSALFPVDNEQSWESCLARELYKLLILSVTIQIVYTFLINFPRTLIAKQCGNKLSRYISKPEFYMPSHVLDVVYLQTIIWLGCFYAPLLPVVGVFIIFVVFYIKKFACLVNCKPSFDIYCASQSHSFYVLMLLISFTFSVIPWAYSVMEMEPSRNFGPFVEYDTVWRVVQKTFQSFPGWVNQVTTFCISSVVLVPLFIILLLTNYYYYAVYMVNKRMVLELKEQLVLEGHDKQFLLNRLSVFIKQQQERYRRT